jgi:hypothetical protein
LGRLRDRSAAVDEPGLASGDETKDMLPELPLLVEKVNTQGRMAFQEQPYRLANGFGLQLNPAGRPDRRFEQPRKGDCHPRHQMSATVRILGKEKGSCSQRSPTSVLTYT